jgi:hypothetical protein
MRQRSEVQEVLLAKARPVIFFVPIDESGKDLIQRSCRSIPA